MRNRGRGRGRGRVSVRVSLQGAWRGGIVAGVEVFLVVHEDEHLLLEHGRQGAVIHRHTPLRAVVPAARAKVALRLRLAAYRAVHRRLEHLVFRASIGFERGSPSGCLKPSQPVGAQTDLSRKDGSVVLTDGSRSLRRRPVPPRLACILEAFDATTREARLRKTTRFAATKTPPFGMILSKA